MVNRLQNLFRRRNYLINLDFQARYIGLLIAVASVMCLITVIAAKYYIHLNLTPLIESGAITSPMAQKLIEIEQNFLNKNLLFIFLSTIGLIFLVGIFITHRIAGPIYAIQNRIHKILAEGVANTKPFQIRKSDEFQELADAFNQFTFKVKQEFDRKDEKIKKLESQQIKETYKRAA